MAHGAGNSKSTFEAPRWRCVAGAEPEQRMTRTVPWMPPASKAVSWSGKWRNACSALSLPEQSTHDLVTFGHGIAARLLVDALVL